MPQKTADNATGALHTVSGVLEVHI
jgi:hypothetical protein